MRFSAPFFVYMAATLSPVRLTKVQLESSISAEVLTSSYKGTGQHTILRPTRDPRSRHLRGLAD